MGVEDNLRCQSSRAIYPVFIETGSLTGPRFTKWARLASQPTLRIQLSPPLQQ